MLTHESTNYTRIICRNFSKASFSFRHYL